MWPAELDAMVRMQAAMPDGLLYVWRLVSHLGDSTTLFVLIAVLAWSYHTRRALEMAVALSLSGLAAGCLKLMVQAARPWMVHPDIHPLIDTGGFGMPSGHALSTAVFFGLLAVYWRTRPDSSLAGSSLWLLPALAVGVSRIVLGVHSPGQVLTGWALGALVVALFAWLRRRSQSASIVLTALALPLLALVYYRLLHQTLSDFAIPQLWQQRFSTLYGIALTREHLAGGARVYLVSLTAGCVLAGGLLRYTPDTGGVFLSLRERLLGLLLGALVLSSVIAVVARLDPGSTALHALALAIPLWTFVASRWLLRQLGWRWL